MSSRIEVTASSWNLADIFADMVGVFDGVGEAESEEREERLSARDMVN